MSTPRIARWLAAVAVMLSWSSATSAASCDEACLAKQLDHYLAKLVVRDAQNLNLAADVRFTENGQVQSAGEGLWKTASALGAYQHRLTDAMSQQAMFIGLVNEGQSAAIVTIRLGIADGKIAEIEHVIARKGSHPLFAPEAFIKPHESLTMPIPAAKRLTREKLIAIADTYFEGIEQHDSKIILSTESCQRIENGVQTTNQPGRTSRNCAHSADLLTYIKGVNDRRFPIVDIEHGIVVSTILFDIPGEKAAQSAASQAQISPRMREPRTLLLTEWFKIDDGKIQHIEAIMHNLPQGSKSGWEH